jgi:hypothetical protein
MANSERDLDEISLSPEEEARIDAAIANARDPYDDEVAVAAEYDSRYDLLIVRLKTGQRLAIPREDLQELAVADPDEVRKVQIEMLGMSLHWEELNVDFRVDGLRRGLYGSERWMKQLNERRQRNATAALERSA